MIRELMPAIDINDYRVLTKNDFTEFYILKDAAGESR